MKLIRKLGTRLNKNGNLVSYGEFLCPFDNKIVIKNLSNGKRQKSCGCVGHKLTSETNKGKKRTEEQNKRNSELAKERFKNPKNHPMYGKNQTEETKQKIRQANTGRLGEKSPLFGKKKSEEHIKRNSESHIGLQSGKNNPMYGRKFFGKENPNWNGGTSFLPYPIEFNKELKQFILKRDNYTCQCPNCEHKTDLLDIHHIDYNKKNNNIENLITLCDNCHTKTNGKNKRNYWTKFYQNIILNK